jgi:hypothetical protein
MVFPTTNTTTARPTWAAPSSQFRTSRGLCGIPQPQSPNPLNAGPAMAHHAHPNQGDPAPFPAGPTLNNVVFSSPEHPVTDLEKDLTRTRKELQ